METRHLSVLNFKFNFIFDGGRTREEQIALSLKQHLFLHGGRKPKAFWIYYSTLPPISNIFFDFWSSALKWHLLKRHLTLFGSRGMSQRRGQRKSKQTCHDIEKGGGQNIPGLHEMLPRSKSKSRRQAQKSPQYCWEFHDQL